MKTKICFILSAVILLGFASAANAAEEITANELNLTPTKLEAAYENKLCAKYSLTCTRANIEVLGNYSELLFINNKIGEIAGEHSLTSTDAEMGNNSSCLTQASASFVSAEMVMTSFKASTDLSPNFYKSLNNELFQIKTELTNILSKMESGANCEPL